MQHFLLRPRLPLRVPAAERISGLFTEAGLEQPEWQPVLLGGLFQRFDRGSWSQTPARAEGIAEVERRAAAYGLPPIVWPDPWPGNTLIAMRVATFAKQTGRTVSFSLAAFRQAFAAGRDLSDPDNVLIAAAACELHPRALLKAVADRDRQGRAARGDRRRAGDLGVIGVPALVVGERGLLGRRPARGGGRGGRLGVSASLRWLDGRSARRRHLLRAARAHGADPPLRGGGGAPVPAGQSRRLPAPGDRRGGDDRRHHLGDARRGLPDRHLPHPRPRDRPRHRAASG